MKPGRPKRFRDKTVSPTLKELGVSKGQSSRWQLMASLPAEVFEDCIAKRLTESAIVALAKELWSPSSGPGGRPQSPPARCPRCGREL